MPRSTPWGAAQQVENHLRGFSTVSTAGHGGMMVSRGAAMKYLSEPARKHAHIHHDYFCYEEDCDYLIPLFDARELRPQLMAGIPFWENKTDAEIEKYLIERLSDYHFRYLLDVGIRPDPVTYKKACLRESFYEALNNHSADVMAACKGDSTTFISGVYEVSSGDGAAHFVTKESFEKMIADPYLSISCPMRSLDRVDINKYPDIESRLGEFVLDKAKPYSNQIESNHEKAVKEAEGNCYGPRAQFNGVLSSIKGDFISATMVTRDVSQDAAEKIFIQTLGNIRPHLHPELRNIPVFIDYFGILFGGDS